MFCVLGKQIEAQFEEIMTTPQDHANAVKISTITGVVCSTWPAMRRCMPSEQVPPRTT